MSRKEFDDLIINDLLAEFCNHPDRRYGIAGFKDNLSEVDDLDAADFVRGMNAGLVKLDGKEKLYRAPRSHAGEQFFWTHGRNEVPRKLTLWIEPIITIATLSRLHFDLNWPVDLLGTQSIDYAFDVTAYLQPDFIREHIACEVKKTVREMESLVEHMRDLGASPLPDIIPSRKNARKKVEALRSRRAPILWVVGPGGRSAVFNLSYSEDDLMSFAKGSITNLEYPGPHLAQPEQLG